MNKVKVDYKIDNITFIFSQFFILPQNKSYNTWVKHVMWGRRWGRQVIYFIDLKEKGINNVVVNHFKVGVAHPVFKVPLGASEKVVRHYHFVTLRTKY